MIEFDGEFYAAIIGAIVGSVLGGCVSYFLQRQSLRAVRDEGLEQRKYRDKSLAYSMYIKVGDIFSNLTIANSELKATVARAANQKRAAGWQDLQPFATLPMLVHFSPDEKSLLLHLKKHSLFNDISSLDRVHNNYIEMIGVYGRKRTEFTSALPIESMDESRFTSALAKADMLRFGPTMGELDQLVQHLIKSMPADIAATEQILQRLGTLFMDEFQEVLKFEPKPVQPSA